MRVLLVAFLLLCSQPAGSFAQIPADLRPAQACMQTHTDAHEACLPKLVSQCDGNLTADCLKDLTNRWIKLGDQRWPVLRKHLPSETSRWFHLQPGRSLGRARLTCLERQFFRALTTSFEKATLICNIYANAIRVARMHRPAGDIVRAHQSYRADIESLEACIVESAVSDQAENCIGMLHDFCLQDAGQPDICEDREWDIWRSIRSELQVHAALTADDPPAGLKALRQRIGRQRHDCQFLRRDCMRPYLTEKARQTIRLFLLIE